jgi:hypothetical protein
VLAQEIDQLVCLWKAITLGELTKHDATIVLDIENSPTAWNKLCFQAKGFLHSGGQTGRLGQIVSLLAVGDAEGRRHVRSVANKSRSLQPNQGARCGGGVFPVSM